MTSPIQEQAQPLQGLPEWLRDVASSPATSEPHANDLRRWADAVEAIAPTRDAAMSDTDRTVYLIKFDDADCPPEIVIGTKRAMYRFGEVSVSWNAHLFGKIKSNTRDEPRFNDNVTLAGEVEAAGRAPLTDAQRKRDYDKGWVTCAVWAERLDLIADCDSKAYDEVREKGLVRALLAVPALTDCCEGQGTCTHQCAWGRGFDAARADPAFRAAPAETGYEKAFYELSAMLGIKGAQAKSPEQAYSEQVKPALEKLIADRSHFQDAYLNMREWAEQNGLDTITYGSHATVPAPVPVQSAFKPVGKADFHMSAELDVCIGDELYIAAPAQPTTKG